jgi:hypothetical protein
VANRRGFGIVASARRKRRIHLQARSRGMCCDPRRLRRPTNRLLLRTR